MICKTSELEAFCSLGVVEGRGWLPKSHALNQDMVQKEVVGLELAYFRPILIGTLGGFLAQATMCTCMFQPYFDINGNKIRRRDRPDTGPPIGVSRLPLFTYPIPLIQFHSASTLELVLVLY
jgi:hypothetical protein